MRVALVLLALASAGRAARAAVDETPSYDLAVRFGVYPDSNRGTAQGTMTIKGWGKAGVVAHRCLYLPYADPDYEFDPIRDFDLVPRKYAKPMRTPGAQTLKVLTPGMMVAELSPYVVEIVGAVPSDGLTLRFDSQLPRWPDATSDEWLYSDFHPQPLVSCPTRPDDSRTFTLVPDARIKATVARPAGWQLASPGLPVGARPSHVDPATGDEEFELTLSARKLVVAVLQNFRHWALPVPGTSVEVFYHDPGFEQLIPAIQRALSVQTEMFGAPPFPHLVVLETADVEKSSLPGLIAVNHPRQTGMAELQGQVLNWSDWQATAFVAEQWFGASLTVGTLDDLWLLRGFVDFATIESLATEPRRYSLIRPGEGESAKGRLNFDYRQEQDLLAAVLTYLHPYNALTDERYRTLEPFTQQNSLGYVRHALALRQINWTLGRATFRTLLREFTQEHRGRTITPADFAAFYERAVAMRGGLTAATSIGYLRQWWTSDDWPDMTLLDVDDQPTPDGKGHHVRVTVGEDNGFSFPVTVTVSDDEGHVYVAQAHPQDEEGGRWVAEVTTKGASDEVELDTSHQLFDWDRFNNDNKLPQWNFLPGGAKTFADDAYTVFWLPLAAQLPGQPFQFDLVGQAFKYMHNSMTGMLTWTPSTKDVGYSFYYLTDYPKLGSYLVADAIQDKPLQFSNERVIESGFYKSVSTVKDPYIEYGLRLRSRETLNAPETRHQTVALKSQVQPLNQYGGCNYDGKLELERTVNAQLAENWYQRNFAIAEGSCKVASWIELGGRVFGGELIRKVNPPTGNMRFHPQDLNEARLRFDSPVLDRVDRIATAGADVLFPAYLPTPDWLYVLNRETRYRLFYDYGRSEGPSQTYKDAGVGLWVPFGADLVGKGSVSLLNFSALVVLYREAGPYHSHAPGLLFDFDFFGKI